MDTPDIVHRAIYSFCPEYFSWDEATREAWRVGKGQKHRNKFQSYILRKDFGFSKKKTAKIVSGASRFALKSKEQERLNFLDLFFSGMGEDKIVCNELCTGDTTLLSYVNLGAYDRDQFNFQSIARYKDMQTPLDAPYVGDLHGSWFRTLRNEELCYTQLFMLHHYIHSSLEEKFNEILDERIPHSWEEGPNHMKKTPQGNFVHDMKINANGLEKEHDALRRASYNALYAIGEQVGLDMAQNPLGAIWVEDATGYGDPNEQNTNVIFSDPSVLEPIRFSRFWNDVNKHTQPIETMHQIEQKALEKMHAWLDEEWRKIFS
mgnify:CR=1 FL=1